jgi:hypothetical protein
MSIKQCSLVRIPFFAEKCFLKKKSTCEKWVGSSMKHVTIKSYVIFSPFFDQRISSTHLQCFGGILMRDVPHERQVRWPRSSGFGQIAPGTSHDENRQCNEFFSCCHVSMMWGCCTLKFGWFVRAWSTSNQWIHHSFRWHSLLSMNFDDVGGCILWELLSVAPWHKKSANVMPHPNVAPVA